MINLNRNDLDRIKGNIFGDLFFYESVGSTNAEALSNADAADKSLFLAKSQTAGRGRMGRSWEGGDGGIFMTILLKPEKISADISIITLMAGLAISRAVPEAFIKWPNDIVLGDKKAAGILTETRIYGEKGIIAVGIGINANNSEFSEEIEKKATSLYLYTGKKQDAAELIISVYGEFMRLYEDFDDGFSKIREEYCSKCITLNREIVIEKNMEKYVMTAKDITNNGELVAEAGGKRELINFGEVSVRGLLGYI